MKKEEFLEEMKWFVDFYGKTLNDTETKIWYESVKIVSIDEFRKVLKKHLFESESPFFPAIGLITKKFNIFKMVH